MNPLDKHHAMVVFSGGQDSTTCLGWALERYSKVSCVSFDYGQRHEIELEAAFDVIKHFEAQIGREITHDIVNLGPHTFAGTSPLTAKDEDLDTYQNNAQMEAEVGNRVEKTFVPMRNAVFFMLAANRAVCAGASVLVTGVCEADNANYPDCRSTFIESAHRTIVEALGISFFGFTIATPLMHKSKAESIKLALSLHNTYAALAYSHTAYDGNYPPIGKDHASILRAHGFEEADVPDPLVLRAWREGLMELPETPNYRPEKLVWAADYLAFMQDEARV